MEGHGSSPATEGEWKMGLDRNECTCQNIQNYLVHWKIGICTGRVTTNRMQQNLKADTTDKFNISYFIFQAATFQEIPHENL